MLQIFIIINFFEQDRGARSVTQEPVGRMTATHVFAPHKVKSLAPKSCAFKKIT
jgi:hypothetical protein